MGSFQSLWPRGASVSSPCPRSFHNSVYMDIAFGLLRETKVWNDLCCHLDWHMWLLFLKSLKKSITEATVSGVCCGKISDYGVNFSNWYGNVSMFSLFIYVIWVIFTFWMIFFIWYFQECMAYSSFSISNIIWYMHYMISLFFFIDGWFTKLVFKSTHSVSLPLSVLCLHW